MPKHLDFSQRHKTFRMLIIPVKLVYQAFENKIKLTDIKLVFRPSVEL